MGIIREKSWCAGKPNKAISNNGNSQDMKQNHAEQAMWKQAYFLTGIIAVSPVLPLGHKKGLKEVQIFYKLFFFIICSF